MTQNRLKKIARVLWVALLFPFTAVLIAPLHVQITNQAEFIFTSTDLLKTLLPSFLVCLAALTGILIYLRGIAFQRAVSVIFMLSLLLWVQGNLMVWNYGALDGREIDWTGMWPLGLLDSAIWLLGLALAIRHSGWIEKNLVGIASLFLIMIQCVGIYADVSQRAPLDRYQVDRRGQFTFSGQKNVIIFVVDAFQTDVFQELIDEDPALTDLFSGFVYFRNAVSGFRQSYPSVPNLLTATWFENAQPMWDYVREAYLSDTSLPKFFKDHGYRSQVYENRAGLYIDPEVITNIKLQSDYKAGSGDIMKAVDLTLFRYLPHFLKPLIYNNQLWLFSRRFPAAVPALTQTTGAVRNKKNSSENLSNPVKRPARHYFNDEAMQKLSSLQFTDAFINKARVGYTQPVFKFYHLLGTHLPIRMNRNFQYVEPEPDRESLKELARGVVRLLGLLLQTFRELSIFDDSLIVITADHGMWTRIAEVKIPDQISQLYGDNGQQSAQSLPERKGSALPLVLIKRSGARGTMRTSDAPIALSDIPRTLVIETGFDGSSFPGASVFDLAENQPRQRRVLFSTFKSNPSYSEPYRSTMTEFLVDGFSWLDASWEKTGNAYPPADQR